MSTHNDLQPNGGDSRPSEAEPTRTDIDDSKPDNGLSFQEQREDILNSISLTGAVEAINALNNPIILGSRNNLNQILNLSSGLPRIRTDVAKKFELILIQPSSILGIKRHDIRCCLCKKIVFFPCWYYDIKYAVNHFHYFVCFDSNSPEKVNARCYRRE